MPKNQQGFSVVELLVVLLAVVSLAAAGGYVWKRGHAQTRADPTKLSTATTTLVELKNSGSTNFTGWDLHIYSDGSARLRCDAGPQLNKSCTSGSYKLHTFSASTLSKDLTEARLNPQYGCIRSVSFGSTETLVYNHKTVTGIDCYFDANPNAALSKDIANFLQQTGLS